MSYENKTPEELIESLEDRDGKIDELKQEIETMKDDYNCNTSELNEMYSDCLDKRELEEFAEKAFNAGYNSKVKGNTMLKSWLNFKIGARL